MESQQLIFKVVPRFFRLCRLLAFAIALTTRVAGSGTQNRIRSVHNFHYQLLLRKFISKRTIFCQSQEVHTRNFYTAESNWKSLSSTNSSQKKTPMSALAASNVRLASISNSPPRETPHSCSLWMEISSSLPPQNLIELADGEGSVLTVLH
jgi:hypothetical protein